MALLCKAVVALRAVLVLRTVLTAKLREKEQRAGRKKVWECPSIRVSEQ
jgi:hypothetical protein